jgi:hypothetical protein
MLEVQLKEGIYFTAPLNRNKKVINDQPESKENT